MCGCVLLGSDRLAGAKGMKGKLKRGSELWCFIAAHKRLLRSLDDCHGVKHPPNCERLSGRQYRNPAIDCSETPALSQFIFSLFQLNNNVIILMATISVMTLPLSVGGSLSLLQRTKFP